MTATHVSSDSARSQMVRFFRVGIALTLLSVMHPVRAEGTSCEAGGFIVVSASTADVETICAAAADTVRFMEQHGFEVGKIPTTVTLVPTVTEKTFSSILGAFNSKTNHIELLSYKATLKQFPGGQVLGVSMSPDLYRSFIVHEMAHAIAHTNFTRRPVVSAHEYIAYTVQLALMSDELRAVVLDSVDTDAYDDVSEVSDMLFMLDPHRFAVKSYLHFFRPENRASAFKKLLAGKF